MIDLGVAALAIDLVARPATRIRAGGRGRQPNGTFVAPAPVETPIRAAVQDLKAERVGGEDALQRAASGERLEQVVSIWTRADLIAADEEAKTPGDEVRLPDGRRFEVVTAAPRNEAGFTFARGRLIRDRGRSV